MTAEADFSGYATRSGLRCSDGRTILPDAFADNHGAIVPLVWQHGHDDAENVLGHVRLENRSDGVYCHAYFNETAKGKHAKEMVKHGDVKWLSIFANNLTEKIKDRANNFRDVLKGNIREVSLVLAGANPGAMIEERSILHSDDDFLMDEAVITSGLDISLAHTDDSLEHAEDDEKTLQEILDTLNDEQETAVNYLLSQALAGAGSAKHSEISNADIESFLEHSVDDSLQKILNTLDDVQETAVNFLLYNALQHAETLQHDEDEEKVEESDDTDNEEEAAVASSDDSDVEDDADNTDEAGDDSAQHDNTQEDNSMTHNVFDQAKQGGTVAHQQIHLSHDDVRGIVEDAANNTGSLKKSLENFVRHTGITVDGTLQHGIENIEYLFPDSKTLENSPAFVSRRMEWVEKVLNSVRKSPFSRIKTITADITPDEARARGYIKGNMKNEEFFALSKRETTPQTIYKKQKLDRDDVVDIVDLDVVAWLKAEMKVMLDEELAGAILIGDGRSIGDEEKIQETKIRPVASDAELYVTTVNVNVADTDSSIEELVDAAIENRRYYKGTGQPTFYTTEATISAFLTVKDNFGRRIYSNLQEVASVLRVSEVVPVEVMERVPGLIGIMVNLSDYTLGADKGGQATMFDDFDINYNKLLYLIETRVSGALTLPKSALVFRAQAAASQELAQPEEPTFDGTTVTVPTVTNVTYKNADTDVTLTTAAPVTLAAGETLNVVAVPATGYYFPNNAEDQWTYTNEG